MMAGHGPRATGYGLGLVIAAACGHAAVFRLSGGHDNDRAELHAALAHRHLDDRATPTNSAHAPRVFAVVAGPSKLLVAYDLAGAKTLWQVAADVASRVWVGGDVVLAREGSALVARAQADGAVKWRLALAGDLIGAAADRERAYVAWHSGAKSYIAGYDAATGAQLWKLDADGQLGAPAAHGGVVYVPFLAQWLSIVDGKTGEQLARLRGTDDQIAIVRADASGGLFGSKRGVRALDEAALAGGPPLRARVPQQLDRASYGPDAYDPVDLAYTANDRARVLVGADSYAVHYFRYVFGFGADGALAWAYAQPRVELVASAHAGTTIVAIAQTGEIVALDPTTGAPRFRDRLAATGSVVGATFDADGWTPQQQLDAPPLADTLAAIAKDRDARFERVKELAVTALATAHGDHATAALLDVLADDRATPHLKDVAATALAARADPAGLPALEKMLETRADFIAKTEPIALGAVARAIGSLAKLLPPERIPEALAALEAHLDAPTTPVGDLVEVVGALAALGSDDARRALTSHLLIYRADELADVDSWCAAIARGLAERGPGGRVVLEQVAADPRTRPTLVAAIREVLAR